MQCVLLVGGEGKRLWEITRNEIPKPMVDIADKPYLHRKVEYLRGQGVTDIIMAICHKGEIIKQYFGDGEGFGVNIEYSVEDSPKGTGGAVKLAQDMIKDDDFIVSYGDVVLDINLNEMLMYHKRENMFVTMAVPKIKNVGAGERFGKVYLGIDDRVIEFIDKEEQCTEIKDIDGGIYIVKRKALELINSIYTNKPFKWDDVLTRYSKLDLLQGYRTDSEFIDIGVPEGYKKATEKYCHKSGD